ncbi:hypothetical protein [Sphingopyxis sp.]|uniref:hypothetical protein n=1 Tax=Sphingopyxis sp. TaxID=1908224 RepID=UPI002B46DC6F|nr:hypothetical protein [Sphingopyxis sp.]HJS11356.1 hypothetical protein [Sphingopyxis sp.]
MTGRGSSHGRTVASFNEHSGIFDDKDRPFLPFGTTHADHAAFHSPQPNDHFERFGQRGADATQRSLRTAVVKILKLKWRVVRPRRRRERERMKKLLTIFAISGSILILSACNTVEGAGKDVESAAECADGVKDNC